MSNEQNPTNTAFLIDVPEDLSTEQRQDYARRIARAINREGIEGARITQTMPYDHNGGDVVLYQP